MKVSKHSKLAEWQKKYADVYEECPRCHRDKLVTIEHVIPCHFLEELGLWDEAQNDEDNFELLCQACNKFKGGRIDMANPKTIPLLKKYVNRL